VVENVLLGSGDIWPYQQTTVVENALLGSGDGNWREDPVWLLMQQFVSMVVGYILLYATSAQVYESHKQNLSADRRLIYY